MASKERPILFSAPMVRAILDGQKTQTRRLIVVPPRGAFVLLDRGHGLRPYASDNGDSSLCDDGNEYPMRCPHGVPGDRLWVRETHAQFYVGEGMDREVPQCVAYRATCDADGGFDYVNGRSEIMRLEVTKWTPAIHMPRWASRIDLEITGVRVEQLQDISEEDAIAEGVVDTRGAWEPLPGEAVTGDRDGPREAFRVLWDQINGKHAPWASNPWLWVISFRRVRP